MASFDDFKAQFSGDLVTPHDPDYEKAISRWAANAIRRAAVVAFVKSHEDIALAIKYARSAALRIGIRGGGHSAAGNSSAEGGLVIDLSKYYNGVRIDPDKKLAYVQGGAVWKDVDEAAIKHGLAGVGGTVNHTGVGGLSVGGGYGWLSGSHGLVIDNTEQVTVVTADGSVLVANENENTDLFWGVRGGGSNFGIVTEFVFRLHPQREKVFAGPLIFPPDKVTQVGAVLDQWWASAKPESGALVGLTKMHGNPAIVTIIFFNGSAEQGKEEFKGLFELGPVVDHTGEVPYEALNGLTNQMVEWGACYYFKGALLHEKPSEDVTEKKLQLLLELAEDPTYTVTTMHEYLPHGKINSVSGDATPYRRDLRGNAVIAIQWKDNTPEKNLRAKEISHKLAELGAKGEPYGNYLTDSDALPVAGAVPVDRTKELFRDNYPRLQSIKKKYDPDMVFNQWYTIVPN